MDDPHKTIYKECYMTIITLLDLLDTAEATTGLTPAEHNLRKILLQKKDVLVAFMIDEMSSE